MKKLLISGLLVAVLSIVVYANTPSIVPTDIGAITISKELVFTQTSLAEILEKISHESGVTIIALPETGKMVTSFTVKSNTSLSDVLDMIKKQLYLEYKMTSKGILLFPIGYFGTHYAQTELDAEEDIMREDSAEKSYERGHFRLAVCKAEGFVGQGAPAPGYYSQYSMSEPFSTEEYSRIYSNKFLEVLSNPLSTFSIDVDTAAYSNIRRFVNNGELPPQDAVRIEELLNYFTYDYPEPSNNEPFSITTEVSECPWNTEHKLVKIGLKGRNIDKEKLPPSNLVFLIDVSGSMSSPNKLGLLKKAFKLLVQNLRKEDRVSIVVYAGAAGLVLDSVSGDKKSTITQALDQLQAGGSTAGGQGIKLAYKIAKQNLITGGNNRVILATDGDFNVGVSSTGALTRLIEEKRNDGIYLTVLGFGMGNLKDSRMETLADKGNGNYGYIDTLTEAKKMLVNQMAGTLFAIAKDVKIQVEFNPAKVKEYRLIGYENRLLAKEDFADDSKDAGELGVGHTVTAMYEIQLLTAQNQTDGIDSLKYQTTSIDRNAYQTDEILTVKLRYKNPDEDVSNLLDETVRERDSVDFSNASVDFRFSTAVVEVGLILRDSDYKGNASYEHAILTAKKAKGKDQEGYRADFIRLAEVCELIELLK